MKYKWAAFIIVILAVFVLNLHANTTRDIGAEPALD